MPLLGFELVTVGLQFNRFSPHGHHACDVTLHNYYCHSEQILHWAKRWFIKGFFQGQNKNHHIFNITYRSSFISMLLIALILFFFLTCFTSAKSTV